MMNRKYHFNPYLWVCFVVCLFSTIISSGVWAESISYQLNAGEYTLKQTECGKTEIIMQDPDYTNLHSPGDPLLPEKIISFQVPSDADLSDLSLYVSNKEITNFEGSYDIIPQLPDTTDEGVFYGFSKSIVNGRNMFVYAKDALFPDSPVELLPATTRKEMDIYVECVPPRNPTFSLNKIIRVAYKPFLYNPVQQSLMLVKKATITLTYDVIIPRVSSTTTNIMPQAGSNADYVIITTNNTVSRSTRLADFVRMKELEGHAVRIVTENDFGSLTGQYPDGTAEKIRQWLINNYVTMGIDYVLLIGDPHPASVLDPSASVGDIPMKMCYPRYFEPSYRDSPTDYFYADLTGNWDLDGDAIYGEEIDHSRATSPIPGSIDSETFSARWTGQVHCDFAENYVFSTFTDDGVRVYLDGNLIINNWTDHSPTSNTSASQAMTIGNHNITVEYYENTVDAVIRLYWRTPNNSTHIKDPTIIPQDHLYHLDPGTGTFVSGGLDATYYDDLNFGGTSFTRVDNVIDFIWATGDNGPGQRETGAEVFVGRIPVYNDNYTDLDSILGKIISYETDPGNINWRSSILLPMKPLDDITPSYHVGEGIRTDFALAAGFDVFRIYDKDYSTTPGGGPTPELWPCTVNNVQTEWLNGYGMVTWMTHGSSQGASGIFDSNHALNLNNATPAFTYQASCTNGMPEDTNNLGYALLRNGAVATVSGSRVTWYSPGNTNVNQPTNGSNECIAYAYTKKVIDNGQAAGVALADYKGDLSYVGMNEMDYNLYGEPDCFLLSVNPNQRPVAEANGPYTGNEGSTITVTGSGSFDPEGDNISYRWDLNNDGTWDTSWSASPTATISRCDNMTVTVRLQVKDSLGLTGEDTATVTFVNVRPSVNAGSDQTTDEATTFSVSGSFTDPGCDSWTYAWNFGDGTPNVTGSLSATHAYGDNGTFTVTLRVTDDDGGVGTDTLQVVVRNVPPTASIDSISQPNPLMIFTGNTLTMSGSFTDPGWLDTHTSLWDFGDGTSASGTLTEEHNPPDSTGTTTVTKVYTAPGTYTITLTIRDDDGGVGTATRQITVLASMQTTGTLILADRTKLYTPAACGGTYTEVGADSLIKTSTLLVNGNVFLRSRARVEGNVKISGTCQRQDGTVITGTLQENVPVTISPIPTQTVSVGSTDLTVNNEQTTSWTPGTYRDGMVRARGRLTLTAGTYNFRNLTIEPDTNITLNTSSGPIYINVDQQFNIGDRAKQVITGDPTAINYYTNCTGTVRIGTDTQLTSGCIIAPNATLSVSSRTTVKGAVCVKQLRTEPDVTVNCGM